MRNKLRTWAALGTLIILFLMSARQSSAATKQPSGVTISPAFQQVSINQNELEQAVTFRITNNQSKAQTYNLSAADFNTLGESGGLFFVGTNPTELQKKYGLAKWFSLPAKTIIIQPKQTYVLKAMIENLPDLTPGGHYGALMLSQSNGSSNNQVSVHPIASSLMFVTKLGGDTHMLGLNGVETKHSLFSLPSNITLRFHDDGNTHLTPRGIVTISTPQGRLITRGIINEDSNIILPETYRRYNVQLKKVSSAYAVGRYVLNVNFRFDGLNQFRRYQVSFLYVPMAVLVGAGAIVLAVAGIIINKLKQRKTA